MTVTRLQTPFPSLTSDNFLSRGSAGQVFAISREIVFKCPTSFEDPVATQAEEMGESVKRIEHEKVVYKILMEHRHPNIVHGILCVPEGLFMQRLSSTLEFRIDQSTTLPISRDCQHRWIQQLTSALAWIEQLGYVHGDLRPANIFLDETENIKLGDFDCAVKKGEQLLAASEPFCKLNEAYEPPPAGPISEQFALASCLYNIRFGNKPFHQLNAPTRVLKLIRNEFPATSADHVFGATIQKCWKGAYGSIGDLQEVISTLLYEHLRQEVRLLAQWNTKPLSANESLRLERKCQEFVEIQRAAVYH